MSVLIGGSIVSDSSQLVAGRTNKNPRRERGAFWLADLAGWIRPSDPTNHGGPGDYRPAHLGRALLGSRLFSLPRDPGWWGGWAGEEWEEARGHDTWMSSFCGNYCMTQACQLSGDFTRASVDGGVGGGGQSLRLGSSVKISVQILRK